MEKSKCCDAEVQLRGDCEDRHPALVGKCHAAHTCYYECTECREPCDIKV